LRRQWSDFASTKVGTWRGLAAFLDPLLVRWNQGVVYELDMAGQETVLHSFTGGADGGEPLAGVALSPAGNLYGATSGGGTGQQGVIFGVVQP
jgi:hypothetical protein